LRRHSKVSTWAGNRSGAADVHFPPLLLADQLLGVGGGLVALVGGPLTGIQVVLGPVQGGAAAGQPGLGRLQRLLGLPSARASAARTRASSTALAATRARCASWTTSWATSASLREDDRARPRNRLNASSRGSLPWRPASPWPA
jgi:hypothetical protein